MRVIEKGNLILTIENDRYTLVVENLLENFNDDGFSEISYEEIFLFVKRRRIWYLYDKKHKLELGKSEIDSSYPSIFPDDWNLRLPNTGNAAIEYFSEILPEID